MKLRINLQALDPVVPGRARLYVRDLEGELGLEAYSVAIVRSQDRHYLHADKAWGASLRWLPLHGWDTFEEGFAVLVDAGIVDPLLANSSDAYQLLLGSADGQEVGKSTLRLDKAILPSTAGGNAQAMELTAAAGSTEPAEPVDAPAPAAEAAPAQPVEPAHEPQALAEPADAASQREQAAASPAASAVNKKGAGGGKALLWMMVTVLAAGIAAAAAYFFLKKPPEEPAAASVSPPSAPSASADACAMDKLAGMPGLQFVQECVKEPKTSEQWLAVIEQAKQAGQCDVAQRLYVHKAQAGNVRIALAYAREYDPQTHQAQPCFSQANPATAAYWYETVLLSEPGNAQAKARYEELSK